MTLVAREIVESQRLEGTVPSLTVGQRRWKVYDDTGATVAPGVAMGAPDIPVRGEQDFPGQPEMVANAFRVLRADQDSRYCLVEIEYVHISVFAEGPLPGEPGFVKQESEVVSSIESIWRNGPSFIPADGVVPSGDDYTDIGGNRVDINGVPVDYPVKGLILTITEHRAAPLPLNVWLSAKDRRNDGTYLGYSTGAVLYGGARVQLLHNNIFSVQHLFDVRESAFSINTPYHLRQTVVRSQSDRVATTPVLSPPAGIPVPQNAQRVVWRQLYALHPFAQIGLYF